MLHTVRSELLFFTRHRNSALSALKNIKYKIKSKKVIVAFCSVARTIRTTRLREATLGQNGYSVVSDKRVDRKTGTLLLAGLGYLYVVGEVFLTTPAGFFAEHNIWRGRRAHGCRKRNGKSDGRGERTVSRWTTCGRRIDFAIRR